MVDRAFSELFTDFIEANRKKCPDLLMPGVCHISNGDTQKNIRQFICHRMNTMPETGFRIKKHSDFKKNACTQHELQIYFYQSAKYINSVDRLSVHCTIRMARSILVANFAVRNPVS